MRDIKNKIAFITGGNKGIGLGIAKSFLEAGGKVAITGRNEKDMDSSKKLLSEIGGEQNVLSYISDVRDFNSLQAAVKDVQQKWGEIDLLVANAGLGKFGPIDQLSHEDWNLTIETNLTGVFNTIKAGIETLKYSKGFFITISSLAGTNFFKGGAAYNASKFGLTGFTQAVMLDLREHGIRVSTIMPGSVATYFNDHVPNEEDYWKIQIEDIGQMVVDLMKLNSRTLPSKIEVRPAMTPKK